MNCFISYKETKILKISHFGAQKLFDEYSNAITYVNQNKTKFYSISIDHRD